MLLCSRNARPQKALVGRAQREHNRRPRCFCHSAVWGERDKTGLASPAHGTPTVKRWSFDVRR
jgi:hypothetical protein